MTIHSPVGIRPAMSQITVRFGSEDHKQPKADERPPQEVAGTTVQEAQGTQNADKPNPNEQLSPIAKAMIDFLMDPPIKLPRESRLQVEALAKELNMEQDAVVSLASSLLPTAHYFDSTPCIKGATLLSKDTAEALYTLKENLYKVSDRVSPTGYLKFSPEEWEAFQKAHGLTPTLPVKRNAFQKIRARIPIGKKRIKFKDKGFRDSAEGFYNFIFTFLTGGLMGINWIRVRRHDKQRVLNGINLLHNVVEARRDKPEHQLVMWGVKPETKDGKKTGTLLLQFQFFNQSFQKI